MDRMSIVSIRKCGRGVLPFLGAIAVLLLLAACAPSPLISPTGSTGACGAPALAVAAAHGLTRLAFCDDFDSVATIDARASGEPGFNWYPQNFWGVPTTRSSDYRVESSVLSLLDQSLPSGTGLQTAGPLTYSPPRYVGRVFTAPFYVQIRFAVSKTAAPGSPGLAGCGAGSAVARYSWPTLWMQDVDLLFHQTSRTDPARSEAEIDGIEFYVGCDGQGRGNWKIQMNVHEWSGHRIIGADAMNTPDLGAYGFDEGTFHTIAWLVETAHAGGGRGSVTWYFDGIQVAQATWLPGAPLSSVERAAFDLIMNPGFRTWPIFIDYVEVWQ